MSDLDKYSRLLEQESARVLRRMDLNPKADPATAASAGDAVMQERVLIASRLMQYYEAGVLKLEDIAIATGISMSQVIDVAKSMGSLQ